MKVFNFAKATSLLLLSVNFLLAQMPKITVPPAQTPQPAQSQPSVLPQPPVVGDNTWWYILLFLLFAALAGTIFWMIKSKKQAQGGKVKKEQLAESELWDEHSVDADKEMEWFRKHKKSVKPPMKNGKKSNLPKNLPQASNVLKRNGAAEKIVEDAPIVTEKDFQEKLEKLQYSQLPIARVEKIELSKPFDFLPISNDQALMSAIEQVQDEYEEDEEVRDLALRILAAFRTRNSVESLAQIALYDLSSNLRSKAVGTLADFDHESCFEPILLACADPTREVRAAAARGLFRLSFDRADAWSRIAETGDEFKMRQSARAAIEADLVKRSFDRLAHTDKNAAYEAVTLVALLLRAGETREVFDALKSHPILNVRKAILQIIKLTKEPNALEGLYSLLEKNSLPAEFLKEIDETIKEIGFVLA